MPAEWELSAQSLWFLEAQNAALQAQLDEARERIRQLDQKLSQLNDGESPRPS